MDRDEARRSKVPAGTFRSSTPPPRPAGATPPPPPPEASQRPPKPPAAEADPSAPGQKFGTLRGGPPLKPPTVSVEGDRQKFTSTLVGVPSKTPPPPPASPVLAPPKWRGAGAYGSGQEPQPRVSSVAPQAPLQEGPLAHPDDRRVPHTHITAGAPPPVPVELPPPGEIEEGVGTAAIGDAIQQLLDAQTAVPQEVDEGRAEEPIRESQIELMRDSQIELMRDSEGEPASVRESQIEMVRDSAIEAESPMQPPVRSLPPAAPVARKATATPVATAVTTRVEPSATPDAPAKAPSARWSVPPTPVVTPTASEPVLSDRELASYSFIEREPPREPSVSPAEVAPRRMTDEGDTRFGLAIAAAMLIVGVGGWALTRGGFPMPPRTPPAAAAAPAAATTALPIAPLPGTEPGAPPAAQELGDVAPLPAAPAAPVLAAPKPAPEAQATPTPPEPSAATGAPRSLRPTTRAPARVPPTDDTPAPSSAAPAPAQPAPADSVVTLTPRGEPLPETPTRDNVQAALDAKRTEIVACAAGQRGVAEVDLTVSSAGNVTYAVVGGDFVGTPAGSCIARVVRSAKFAPFSKPRFRVIYPFSL